jgi:hypothetical protein
MRIGSISEDKCTEGSLCERRSLPLAGASPSSPIRTAQIRAVSQRASGRATSPRTSKALARADGDGAA